MKLVATALAPPTPVLLRLKRLIVLHGLDSLMQLKKPLSALIANVNLLSSQVVKLHN